MSIQTEKLFCAEQIEVPLELPEILKAFTKECIRAQPENLVEFAANYFAQMAQTGDSESNMSIEQFVALRQKFEEIDAENIFVLPRETITQVAIDSGISDATINNINSMGKPEKTMDWREFIVLAISVAAENMISAFELIFMTFASQEEPALPTNFFLLLVGFLISRDPSKPPEYMDQLREILETENDGAFKDQVTFEEFAALPIAETLR
ncbi:uncharacterized protein MONOS_1221 [Monocercomonoides exilis]|uniref:uncharacterized protein n=1 Tax=Monocercomonoides exilis TaxID=2049356 RepID=UPI0035596A6F|nr:hypothetical protein MONOS_1221 [Monocercomonoides exilis]|eukprot:MONOS_1221.1-p1 / transcript=MONOS_1221.1 / gene=MONOS_1221 / organism=Monocercomonoides_exilis_PA203 / gene_product=unspecified product / transcript_product=unspecified product / location=Mono_scaffold00021:8228-9129(+) / protein_length=209 / sequence_SO=supercontig / SO=protein_coding / is_pseudo=false